MNKIKYLGLLSITFGIFLVCGIASASNTDQLQPASDVTYDENLVVNATGIFDSIKIGKQGVGGVTFFNGTIVNETTDPDTNAEIPVTFGDDVRIDGAIHRGETAGPGDGKPLKVNDDMKVEGDIEVAGTVDGVDVSEEEAVWYSTDPNSTAQLTAPTPNPKPSKTIAGTATMPACTDPDGPGGNSGYVVRQINFPTNFFTNKNSYVVNATSGWFFVPFYESVGVWNQDRDTITIGVQCEDANVPANGFVSWTATGY